MKWFAEFSRRHVVTAAVIIFVEVLFYRQYASIDAEFHFWLHGLFGAALGLFALTAWRILRPNKTTISPFEAGFLGHIYSAVPDMIFIAFGVLHMYWMDVFALHISIHFIPAPVFTMLIIFLLSLVAYGLAADGNQKYSTALLSVVVVIIGGALFMKDPVPTKLKEVQHHNNSYAWLCPMWDLDPRYSIR